MQAEKGACMTKKRIALFASGSGSNAEKLAQHFRDHNYIEVALLFCNNPDAGVIKRMHALHIPVLVFGRPHMSEQNWVVNIIQTHNIDLIVLAGFLWKIPQSILNLSIPIYNIHPSLLPKFGGRGMYGIHVHKAVLAAGETESGITIHKVTEQYDEGAILFQARVCIDSEETPESLAAKVQVLEHQYFGSIIEQILLDPNLFKPHSGSSAH